MLGDWRAACAAELGLQAHIIPVKPLRMLLSVSRGKANKTRKEHVLDIKKEVLALIDEVLSLGGRAASFDLDTALLGAVPELDSMAVVGLINMMEERFGFVVEDDEIDGAAFATVGSLVQFVEGKLA